MKYHKGLTIEKWSKLSLAMQMANIGADIDRAFRARKNNEPETSRRAFERALELFDLTKMDPKHTASLKEICRLREIFVELFLFDNKYQFTEEWFFKYFYRFNYYAAVQRGLA